MAVVEESEAVTVSGVMPLPTGLVWFPGLFTDTVLVIDQVKPADPVKPSLSVAVTVTE